MADNPTTLPPALEAGLFGLLRMEAVLLTPEKVVIRMPVDERVHQPYGLLHGGATLALAETAASVGTVFHLDPATQTAVGMEINANHLRPKRDGMITATATPLHLGRTTVVWDIRVTDEAERLIAISRCTVAKVARRR